MRFVLVVEGPGFLDRKLWRTHRVLGVYEKREDALENPTYKECKANERDEEIFVLTDLQTNTAERI